MKPWITAAGALLMITTSGCEPIALDPIQPEPGSGGSGGIGNGSGGLGSGGSGGTGGISGTGSTATAGGMGMGGAGGAGGTGGTGGALACQPSTVLPCYSGPPGTEGVGQCAAGTQTCNPDGMAYGPCIGEILPAAEICDAAMQDENCDGHPACTALVAVLDDTTPYPQPQNDVLTVFDPANPNLPLLGLSGLAETAAIGAFRLVATSKSKRRLGVIDKNTLRVFDENLQPLVNVALSSGSAPAVCPTEQAIFALQSAGTWGGTIVKLDSNGSYVGSTSASSYGVDLIVDEDHQVVWTVGRHLTRVTTDLTNEQVLHTFVWAAVSLDLDADGGIWAAERMHPSYGLSVNRLVHFDVNGNLISGDTLTLPGSPMSVRVDRNSGLVWVAMAYTANAGVAYRDVNGQLKTVPGLTGDWISVEPDPLDGSRVWAASVTTGQVVHVDTNGTLIQSLGGFSMYNKWLAVMLQGP